MSLLLRFARGLRAQQHAPYVSPTLTWSLRRWIYNPILKPPHTMGPAVAEQYPEASHPHLPREQFTQILYPNENQPQSNKNEEYRDLFPVERAKLSKNTPEEIWLTKSPRAGVLIKPSDHFAGRSVLVQRHLVGQAWNKLQAILRQNNIRSELRLTERHEKKGVKRRRLRSARWRRKFADEVRKKVKLVNEIRLRDRMWGAGKH